MNFWVLQNQYEGIEKKDLKTIKRSYKRVGNDLHQYTFGRVFIIKDFYSYHKNNMKDGKKLRLANLNKKKAACALLIIACVVIP